jgi:hypothetical protein
MALLHTKTKTFPPKLILISYQPRIMKNVLQNVAHIRGDLSDHKGKKVLFSVALIIEG